jgi:hypothetical protein
MIHEVTEFLKQWDFICKYLIDLSNEMKATREQFVESYICYGRVHNVLRRTLASGIYWHTLERRILKQMLKHLTCV